VEDEKLIAIEAVRKRPGMYVGDTDDGSGVLHLLLELVANAYDQYLTGRCTKVAIDIAADGTITVEDDGPGFSSGGSAELPPLHEMLTQLSRRPTVDGHRPHVHLGLGGMGLFVVNALSERFELRSIREGMETAVAYARGTVVEAVTTIATHKPDGTMVRFRPDPTIFTYPRVPRTALANRLEDLSFLAPRLTLSWKIEGDDLTAGGLAARVGLGVPCELHDVAKHFGAYDTPNGPIDVEVAIAWCRSKWRANRDPVIDSFVNMERTRNHGSHVDGLLDGIRAFFRGRKEKRMAGLVAAVSVVLTDVKFGEPDKSRLVTSEARDPVASATKSALDEWNEKRPAVADEIRSRVSGS